MLSRGALSNNNEGNANTNKDGGEYFGTANRYYYLKKRDNVL